MNLGVCSLHKEALRIASREAESGSQQTLKNRSDLPLTMQKRHSTIYQKLINAPILTQVVGMRKMGTDRFIYSEPAGKANLAPHLENISVPVMLVRDRPESKPNAADAIHHG